MTTASTRAALRSLDAARPAISRLDITQSGEDRAADLIEGWSAVETALRSLVGGSSLAGKPLIHELRARQVISFEQANALADFHSAAERARRTDYIPDEADAQSARQGFRSLETGLLAADAAVAPVGATAAGAAAAASNPIAEPVVTAPGVVEPRRTRARPSWLAPLIGVLVLAVIAVAAWYALGSKSGEKSLMEGVAFYRNGQREQAMAAFQSAARENPNDARPHVYMARMAREVGNLTLARDEATAAIRADTSYALGYREMGAYLLTAGQYDLARQFYVRAVAHDANDKVAMGFLACTMVRLGRYQDAQKWLARAGSGDWDRCAQMPPGAANPAGYPPGYAPQGYPPQGYPQQGYPPQGNPQQNYPPQGYPQQQPPPRP